MKICIIGGPRSGKSTISLSYGVPVFCADPINLVKDILPNVTYLPDNVDWESQSHFICRNWFSMNGSWVIEGVGVVRALRKWVKYYGTEPPCYNILYIKDSYPGIDLLPGQESMTSGIETVWKEIANVYEPITQYKYWGTKSQQRTNNTSLNTSFRMFKG